MGTSYTPPPPLPYQPAALGIDIGADGLHICPAPQVGDPRDWQVYEIDYKADPGWWRWLIDAMRSAYIIAAEPTGWVYLQPVASLVEQRSDAALWLVDHGQTGKYRDLRISSQKTDTTDARALAMIALDILNNAPPLKVRHFNFQTERDVLTLRFAVNAHRKLTAESVRLQNRLRQIGHSLWPSLGSSATWRKLLHYDAITPDEIHVFDLDQVNGNQGRWIDALRADLPTIRTHPHISRLADDTFMRLQEVERLITLEQQHVAALVQAEPFTEVTRRWLTVPCAKIEWLAALHVATHGQAEDFSKAEFKAALGAFPQVYRSGKTDHTRSAKRGYRPAMGAIQLWAMALTNPKNAPIPNPIHEHFAGGEKAGGRKFTAAKAKLASILWGVARSPEGYKS